MLNNRICEVRKAAGLTQEELAQKSGVSRTIITGLESGRIGVTTTRTLQAIAAALDCKVTEVFMLDSLEM